MMRKINVLLSLILIVVGLTACGKTEPQVSVQEVKEAVLSAMSSMPKLSEVNSDSEDADVMFSFICDFDYDKVEEYTFSYSSEGKADEVAIIKLKDEADVEVLKLYLKDENEQRRNQFETYAPEEVPKVINSEIVVHGKYVALIIGDEAGAGKRAFETFFK